MNPESSSHKQAMVRLGGLNRVAASREMNKRAIALYIRFRKRFLNSDRGQALVELAFALPVLLALVYGVFSIGMGMIVYEQLGEAAFAGDQAMSQFEGITGTDLCAKAYTAANTVLAAPAWTAAQKAQVSYSATFENSGGTTTIPASTGSFSCSANLAALGPKGQVSLTLSYPYTWIPIFGSNMGTITITRTQSVLAF